jgi:hypothetical protein
MRYMIIVRAPAGGAADEPGTGPLARQVARELAPYHEALARAGVLLDVHGLKPAREGWRIRFEGGDRECIEGPADDSRGRMVGYALIQVRSRDEAMEWARRCPPPFGPGAAGEIELRPLCEPEARPHA